MVSKVAQQAEHYALSNSKCCWQAGWLGWLERGCLPVCHRSRPRIPLTSAVDSTASLQPHGGPDRTAHHTQIITCMQFLQIMQCFLYSSPHTLSMFCFPCIFWDRCFERGMMSLSVPGSEIRIHLTMQFKDPFWGRGARRSTRYMANFSSTSRASIIHWFVCCIYLFIYLWIIFLLERNKLSCNLLASLQLLYILRDCFYFLVALFFKWIIHKPYGSFVMLQDFKTAVSLLRHTCST